MRSEKTEQRVDTLARDVGPVSMRRERVLDGVRVLRDDPRCLTTRAAPLSVCASRSRRATSSPSPAASRARARPGRARRGARAPRSGSTCTDPSPCSRGRVLAGRVWSSSRDRRRELRRGLQRLARARLGLVRRLRDVRDRDVDLLDGRRLLLGAQLDLARRLGRGRRRGRRSAGTTPSTSPNCRAPASTALVPPRSPSRSC